MSWSNRAEHTGRWSSTVSEVQQWFYDSRHSLIDGLHTVAHGKLIHNLLGGLLKVDLPRVVPFGIGDLHHSVVLDVRHIMEQVLQRETRSVLFNTKNVAWAYPCCLARSKFRSARQPGGYDRFLTQEFARIWYPITERGGTERRWRVLCDRRKLVVRSYGSNMAAAEAKLSFHLWTVF